MELLYGCPLFNKNGVLVDSYKYLNMNHLQYESSPYLLQHAHNPVDWYPWGAEALERAKKENKPILVSIGYSTCHWCHVMERESFEDERVASFMNAYFINIKIDREERPDLDEIYMAACQIINGNGGWPLNCFLTPDLKPFFAGTYYPPEPRHGRKSWIEVLQFILYNFQEARDKVEQQAERILERIEAGDKQFVSSLADDEEAMSLSKDDFKQMASLIAQNFDKVHGGFGVAPKFPNVMQLEFLLDHDYFFTDEEKAGHVHFSIQKMIHGGIYDQIGGGFARYSTDQEWLAPHFEKMLYDNAVLVGLMSNLYKQSKASIYRDTIRETLEFINRELTAANGGFYSALDADSEGVEGKFYVWSEEEIDEVLGDDAPWFKAFYDVSKKGNWEGVSILRRKQSIDDFVEKNHLDKEIFLQNLATAKTKLLQHREQRIRPGLDDKIQLSWNALMATAFIKAFEALGEKEYLETARRNIEFILAEMRQPDGGVFHTYSMGGNGKGRAKNIGFLEDYAYLAKALIDMYEVTFDSRWLDTAKGLVDIVIEDFYDKESKLFFFTSVKQKDVVLRSKNIYDSTMPSGNAVMALNLMKLGFAFENDEYTAKADLMLKSVQNSVLKMPAPFGYWAKVLQIQFQGINEIAIIGENAFQQAHKIKQQFLPNALIMASMTPNDSFPLFRNRPAGFLYLCRNYTCEKPVKTVEELLQLVSASR